MDRKQPAFNSDLFNQMLAQARKAGGLTAALAEFAASPYRSSSFSDL